MQRVVYLKPSTKVEVFYEFDFLESGEKVKIYTVKQPHHRDQSYNSPSSSRIQAPVTSQ
jgi:hypothetical protein